MREFYTTYGYIKGNIEYATESEAEGEESDVLY